MQDLLGLPLSLLPAFLVPIIITSHVLLFQRLILRARKSVGGPEAVHTGVRA